MFLGGRVATAEKICVFEVFIAQFIIKGRV